MSETDRINIYMNMVVLAHQWPEIPDKIVKLSFETDHPL